MLKIKTITIRNFFSYGNQHTVFDLTNKGTTMIVGENLDDMSEGKAANGVGKTTIINAITYALYEKCVSNIKSLDNIINTTNGKDCFIVCEFDKDGVEYKVTRARGAKGDDRGKNFTEILVNGEDVTPAGRAGMINGYIEDIIGLPYELFVRIVVFSATNTPFLQLDAKSSREVIENLFGLTELTKKEGRLKEYIKDIKTKITATEASTTQKDAAYERYLSQLDSAQSRVTAWEAEHEAECHSIQTLINASNIEDLNSQVELFKELELVVAAVEDLNKEQADILTKMETASSRVDQWDNDNNKAIANHKAALEKVNSINFKQEKDAHNIIKEMQPLVSESKAEIASVNGEKTLQTKNKKVAEGEIAELEKELIHLKDATCPYCEQHLAEAEEKIEEANFKASVKQEELIIINTALMELEEKLISLNDTMQSYEDNISEAKKLITVSDLNELINLEEQSKTLDSKIKELEEGQNPHLEALNDFDENVITVLSTSIEEMTGEQERLEASISYDGNVTQLQEFIKRLEGQSTKLETLSKQENPYIDPLTELMDAPIEEPDHSELNKLIEDKDHQLFLQKLLIHKDSFVRKSLLSKNLPYLNKQLALYLNQLSLPYKVEFTPQLSASINRYGKELDFGNLSNGQAARVNLALSFAFRDVLEQIHTKINVCILDEVLDVGLDAVGVPAAAKLLKQKSREENIATYVISHREEVENTFDRKLLIQMHKNFSYLITE